MEQFAYLIIYLIAFGLAVLYCYLEDRWRAKG